MAFAFVVFHTTLICIYAMPKGVLPKGLVKLSSYYTYPVFDQQWSMFAPCPLFDHHVEIKYTFEDGSVTDWISPTKDAISKHMFLRASHHGDLAVAEYNLLYWINTDLMNLDIQGLEYVPEDKLDEFRFGLGYSLAENYAYGNAVYLFDQQPLEAEIRCDYKNVKTNRKFSFYLPKLIWKNSSDE